MVLLRTDEMTNKYKEYQMSHTTDISCVLCTKNSIQEFKRWKIIENDFPYDRISGEHHMLVPMRHIVEEGLNDEELLELKDIKVNSLNQKYDFFMEATTKNKSIPSHFHLHLIVIKDELK